MTTASLNEVQLLHSAHILRAFTECSAELQEHAKKMLAVIVDKSTEEDDRDLAVATLLEILQPYYNEYDNMLGLDLDKANLLVKNHGLPTGSPETIACDEVAQVLSEMETQEATFASRLDHLMLQKGLTQSELAQRIGVGQSAIAMMLKRECRPQKRTIKRLADALGVSPQELWTE